MDQPVPITLNHGCVDSAGAYLLLRDLGIRTIAEAVALLCDARTPSPAEFDVIADGLHLVALEREDDEHLDELDVDAIRAFNELSLV